MTQKITISPVTRIEGHAKITIHLNDEGKVERSLFHVTQYRGFEKFCEGRPFYEMPQITQRSCGICPVSHHLAAAKAVDACAGVVPTEVAFKLRELMHMGQMIQSHGMHFFELAGPDMIMGFDADPAIRNVAGVVGVNPELAVRAVKLRAFGQEIVRRLGERRVHPIFSVVGGVNKPLAAEDREWIAAQIDDHIATTQQGIALFLNWADANQDMMNEFAVFPSMYMGTVRKDGSLDLYDGKLRLVSEAGAKIVEFAPKDYLQYIGEHVEAHTYLKSPFYKPMGWPQGVYRVGPLGRLNAASSISTPLAQEEMLKWKGLSGGRPVEGTLWFHYARLIETLYALERARELLEDPLILCDDVANDPEELTGEGVGCLEAPRGTLFHHYWTDANGLLTQVNMIVATGHNAWAMGHSVDMVAKRYVDGKHLTEGMLNRVEAAIRAHDPCLSCSTHAVGEMPILIQLVDADGQVVDTLRRD